MYPTTALVNFEVPLGSLRSFSFSTSVYIETNALISPKVGAYWNLLVFWNKILINITAPFSVNCGIVAYTKVVKSSLIISVIPSERCSSSFMAAITYLNNTTILEV